MDKQTQNGLMDNTKFSEKEKHHLNEELDDDVVIDDEVEEEDNNDEHTPLFDFNESDGLWHFKSIIGKEYSLKPTIQLEHMFLTERMLECDLCAIINLFRGLTDTLVRPHLSMEPRRFRLSESAKKRLGLQGDRPALFLFADIDKENYFLINRYDFKTFRQRYPDVQPYELQEANFKLDKWLLKMSKWEMKMYG